MGYSKQKRSIKRIATPFNGTTWYPKKSPDLIVLEVVTPFPYKKGKIQPACLPSRSLEVGARCHTVGWGRTCKPDKDKPLDCLETKELNAIEMDTILECPMIDRDKGIAFTHSIHILTLRAPTGWQKCHPLKKTGFFIFNLITFFQSIYKN